MRTTQTRVVHNTFVDFPESSPFLSVSPFTIMYDIIPRSDRHRSRLITILEILAGGLPLDSSSGAVASVGKWLIKALSIAPCIYALHSLVVLHSSYYL